MSALKTIAIIGGVGIVLYFGTKTMMPLGIRNNNPLNIKFNSANDWDGQTGENNGFCVFSSSKFGIRAGAKLIDNYMSKKGLTSVAGIIKKWAPPSDNNPTNNYVEFVAKEVGVNAADNNLSRKHIPIMIRAMIKFENGLCPYSDAKIIDGCKLAGVV
ncbi:structural protein P5 [Photobacterium damselae]|uniref:structural protein P5 n=1 Tax=Photobacterium damselae TaxID=38293 RepID=UPI0040676DA8